jgi:hypothetical protein
MALEKIKDFCHMVSELLAAPHSLEWEWLRSSVPGGFAPARDMQALAEALREGDK